MIPWPAQLNLVRRQLVRKLFDKYRIRWRGVGSAGKLFGGNEALFESQRTVQERCRMPAVHPLLAQPPTFSGKQPCGQRERQAKAPGRIKRKGRQTPGEQAATPRPQAGQDGGLGDQRRPIPDGKLLKEKR